MNLGIVGSEAAKFTPETRAKAKQEIARLIVEYDPDLVISGHSPLGGIDIWAVDIANEQGVETLEFPPRKLTWEGGYKQRNLQIAQASDVVACVVVRELPPGFKGMRFAGCYHCARYGGGPVEEHVKSGGCWTMWQAARMGKTTELVIVR